jgi:plasmid stabilization system protein ParE
VAEARIDRHSAVVEQDLPEIYSFIAQRDPAAAERVLDAVKKLFGN